MPFFALWYLPLLLLSAADDEDERPSSHFFVYPLSQPEVAKLETEKKNTSWLCYCRGLLMMSFNICLMCTMWWVI